MICGSLGVPLYTEQSTVSSGSPFLSQTQEKTVRSNSPAAGTQSTFTVHRFPNIYLFAVLGTQCLLHAEQMFCHWTAVLAPPCTFLMLPTKLLTFSLRIVQILPMSSPLFLLLPHFAFQNLTDTSKPISSTNFLPGVSPDNWQGRSGVHTHSICLRWTSRHLFDCDSLLVYFSH
jgi:hypothetical protein